MLLETHHHNSKASLTISRHIFILCKPLCIHRPKTQNCTTLISYFVADSLVLVGDLQRAEKMASWVALCMLMASAWSVASAKEYTVGDNAGWGFSNYTAWTSGKTFRVGDKLLFKYDPQKHNVIEVNKQSYDSCQSSSAIKTYQTGSDTITLSNASTRYFICGFPTHCTSGMKLQVKVLSSSSSSAKTPSPSPSLSPSPSASQGRGSAKSPTAGQRGGAASSPSAANSPSGTATGTGSGTTVAGAPGAPSPASKNSGVRSFALNGLLVTCAAPLIAAALL